MFWLRVPNLVSRLLIPEVAGDCARWRLGHFVYINQRKAGYDKKCHISQVEPRNCRNSSIYIPSSNLHLQSLFPRYQTCCQHSEQSLHHLMCRIQCLLFQNTRHKLRSFFHSLLAAFRYDRLFHNKHATVVDWLLTRSDSTKGQPQRKWERTCNGKNAGIG